MEALSFSPEAQDKLLRYYYPGNVRELKAMVELAAVLSTGNTITADDIRLRTPRATWTRSPSGIPPEYDAHHPSLPRQV